MNSNPARVQSHKREMLGMFEEIRSAYPSLKMDLQLEHPHADLLMEISHQPGMTFDVYWLEMFPCDRAEVVQSFRDAVDGVLSGRYRIEEQYLGKRIVKAHLQRPKDDGWETIATCYWATLLGFIPWWPTTKVLQNLPATP